MPESASPAPSLSCLCLPARSTSAGRRTSFCRMSRPPDCAPQPDAPPFALSALRSSRPARLTPPSPSPTTSPFPDRRTSRSEAGRFFYAGAPRPPHPSPPLPVVRSHSWPLPQRCSPAIPPAGRALLHPSASPLPFSLPSAWCRCRLRLPHGTKRIKKQEPSAMPPHHERPLLRPYSELRKARFPAQKRADKILSIPCKVYQECHAD